MNDRDRLLSTGRLREQVPLGPLTTYKVGGPARWLLEAADETDLLLVASWTRREGLPTVVLGRGSNVVVSDRGFAGVVIHPGSGMDRRAFAEDGSVTAGAATPLPVLAREAARRGRGGLEFFTGIPGTVGGAVRMNAGCHGSETGEWLRAARVVDLHTGDARWREASTLGMTYRHSDLGDHEVVSAAVFRTDAVEPGEAERRIREITRWRREHQPGGTLNAGSVFKNPPGDVAGRLIDAAGLKGLAVGVVEVSHRHANFFVAGPGATAGDLHALVALVRERVATATGILLEPEVRFIGDFG